MERFWERSWSGVDMDRVERYIDSEDTTEDYIISCLREQGAETVCDAGCGCGAYSVKLVANGFEVFGFDVAAGAVKIAEELMPKEDNIEVEGVVVECLRNAMFKVKLSNGHIVLCTISGKIRMHYIKILVGDTVKLEMSPYDLTKGRITYRHKN